MHQRWSTITQHRQPCVSLVALPLAPSLWLVGLLVPFVSAAARLPAAVHVPYAAVLSVFLVSQPRPLSLQPVVHASCSTISRLALHQFYDLGQEYNNRTWLTASRSVSSFTTCEWQHHPHCHKGSVLNANLINSTIRIIHKLTNKTANFGNCFHGCMPTLLLNDQRNKQHSWVYISLETPQLIYSIYLLSSTTNK